MRKRFIRFSLLPLVVLLLGWVWPAAAQVPLQTAPAKASARDSLRQVYDAQTIYAYGSSYIKGGRQLPFRQLKAEFGPGAARDLYGQARHDRAVGRLLGVGAVAALVGSAVLRKNQQAGGIALLAVGLGLNFGSLRLGKKSTELVDRALWQRNKDVLFGPRP